MRKKIASLRLNPDPTVEGSVSRAIAEALDDRAEVSLRLFEGLAADVRRGRMAEGCLLDAFESACRATVRNRGKMFTWSIRNSLIARDAAR